MKIGVAARGCRLCVLSPSPTLTDIHRLDYEVGAPLNVGGWFRGGKCNDDIAAVDQTRLTAGNSGSPATRRRFHRFSLAAAMNKRKRTPSVPNHASYLAHLKELISQRTVTTDDDALHAAIDHCRVKFLKSLSPLGWTIACDAAGNLRCSPPSIESNRQVLWLNAHVDTVDATAADFSGRDPFTCFETATHLIGRGANDCKAGVAFMLWYADLIAAGELPSFNGGFLVTRREEAGSTLPRTAPQFAKDMASGALPISTLRRGTFVWLLENTVSLASHLKATVPEVAVYDRERHSFSILCRGSLASLGLAALSLDGHAEWKTVAIWPTARDDDDTATGRGSRAAMRAAHPSAPTTSGPATSAPASSKDGLPAVCRTARRVESEEILSQLSLPRAALAVSAQEGGHSCTVRNSENLIFRCLVREAVSASRENDSLTLPPAALTAWVEGRAMSEGGEGGEGELGTALLWSGVESQPTRVAATVTALPTSAIAPSLRAAFVGLGGAPHTLILNYRGLRPVEEVSAQIAELRAALGAECVQWSAGADLESGEGAQQAEFVGGSLLPSAIDAVVEDLGGAVTLKYEPNPGRSDASHIWRSLPAELRGEKVVPFTCGPGHRSHRCPTDGVMRKTHGPNEGFCKETGRSTLPFFVELVRRFAKRRWRCGAVADED